MQQFVQVDALVRAGRFARFPRHFEPLHTRDVPLRFFQGILVHRLPPKPQFTLQPFVDGAQIKRRIAVHQPLHFKWLHALAAATLHEKRLRKPNTRCVVIRPSQGVTGVGRRLRRSRRRPAAGRHRHLGVGGGRSRFGCCARGRLVLSGWRGGLAGGEEEEGEL